MRKLTPGGGLASAGHRDQGDGTDQFGIEQERCVPNGLITPAGVMSLLVKSEAKPETMNVEVTTDSVPETSALTCKATVTQGT
jgi:hypothetical protein